MNKKVLEVKNLSKTFHSTSGETKAIQDISFEALEGEFIGIVGSSGCGKSTLLNILSDLDKETSGSKKTYNKKIAYMLQSDALLPYLNVLDNACIGLKIENKLTNENINYVKDLLKQCGLIDFINAYPDNLSGGMKQRVALVRTLAIKPDIILLDEPLSALDYVTRLNITDEIYKILKQMNVTTILITHDIAECTSFCDKVIVLSKRPAIVKNVFNIELNNKSIPSINRKDENFNKYYDLIWGEIDS